MNSEKVKEIKATIIEEILGVEYVDGQYANNVSLDLLKDILTLTNELESENAELKKYRCEMEETEFELYCAQKALKGVREEVKQLKERIAELEEGIAKPMVGCEFLPECIKEKEVAIEIITKLEHLQRCIKSVSLNELIISLKKQYGGIK